MPLLHTLLASNKMSKETLLIKKTKKPTTINHERAETDFSKHLNFYLRQKFLN